MVYSCYGFPAGTTSYDISISPTILDLFFFSAGPGISNNRYYNVIKGGFYDILFSGLVESRFMTPALRRVKAGYSKLKSRIRR
jgi:hypothetical protein